MKTKKKKKRLHDKITCMENFIFNVCSSNLKKLLRNSYETKGLTIDFMGKLILKASRFLFILEVKN